MTQTAAPTPARPKHALPAERDEFVGRQAELAELSARWEAGARLVTVLGPGGTGKTRLVRKYAWEQLEDYPGGAWFCDLSETRSLEGLAHAVATTLDVPLGKDDPLVQLGHAIAARGRCLIVLDNFEQVVEHAESCIGPWLERCSDARFVVTSRQRLELKGEELLALEPLPLEGAAVELFELRARAQNASFRVDEQNRADVEEIVRLVDGLPLAIELAAARTRVLAPAKLKARLSDRFKLLVGRRGAADRQSTLRAAIDWSWNMLEPWEQAALAQASVFEGGFTLEAADEVLDLSEFPNAPWPLDLVQLLLDKSLLRTWTPQHAGRRQEIDETYFGMYMSIHEYASDKLRAPGAVVNASGESWSGAAAERAAQERHGKHYAALGSEEALEALDSHGGIERHHTLSLELENLVAACRRAVRRDDGSTAVRAYRAAWAVLELTGPYASACALGREVLVLESLQPRERGPALQVAAHAAQNAGRPDEARAHYAQALAMHRELGDRRLEGKVLNNLGGLHREQGRMDEARAHHEQGLAIARELGSRHDEGIVLGNLGTLHWGQGRIDEARAQYERALAIHRELGERRREGVVLGNLGALHWGQGRMDDARALYERALAIHRDVGDRRFEGLVLGNLGVLHENQGRMDEARASLEQSLALARQLGDRRSEGHALGNLGSVCSEQGRVEEAGVHLEQALAVHRGVGNRYSEALVLGDLGILRFGQGRMDEARGHTELALAIARELGERQIEAGVLCHLGDLHQGQGRTDEARVHCEQALAIARQVGNRRWEGIALGFLGLVHENRGRPDEARAQHEQSLAIAREVGNQGSEATALRSLARLHLDQGRVDEALATLESSLAISREKDDRLEEANALGQLGELHSKQGRFEEAELAFAAGEPMLRTAGAASRLATFLSRLGSHAVRTGDAAGAQARLLEAESIAEDLAAGADSELGRAVSELRESLGKAGRE